MAQSGHMHLHLHKGGGGGGGGGGKEGSGLPTCRIGFFFLFFLGVPAGRMYIDHRYRVTTITQ